MNGDEIVAEFFACRGVDMDSHGATFELIRAASILVAVMEERALRPVGVTHAGYRLLCELWIKGPLETRELAGFMIVSRPSIVGIVDTLEASGLVVRERSRQDRRLVTVGLTSAGRETVERADAAWHECQVQLMAPLSLSEKRELADVARRLAHEALDFRAQEQHP